MIEIRMTHPYGFRSGQWAEQLGKATVAYDRRDRECWIVRFPDGAFDLWPIEDIDAGYETREVDDPSPLLRAIVAMREYRDSLEGPVSRSAVAGAINIAEDIHEEEDAGHRTGDRHRSPEPVHDRGRGGDGLRDAPAAPERELRDKVAAPSAPEPSGTICKCGLAKTYHEGRFKQDHEYEPRYPAAPSTEPALDVTLARLVGIAREQHPNDRAAATQAVRLVVRDALTRALAESQS